MARDTRLEKAPTLAVKTKWEHFDLIERRKIALYLYVATDTVKNDMQKEANPLSFINSVRLRTGLAIGTNTKEPFLHLTEEQIIAKFAPKLSEQKQEEVYGLVYTLVKEDSTVVEEKVEAPSHVVQAQDFAIDNAELLRESMLAQYEADAQQRLVAQGQLKVLLKPLMDYSERKGINLTFLGFLQDKHKEEARGVCDSLLAAGEPCTYRKLLQVISTKIVSARQDGVGENDPYLMALRKVNSDVRKDLSVEVDALIQEKSNPNVPLSRSLS